MLYWAVFLSITLAIEIIFFGTAISMVFPAKPSALAYHFFATYQQAIVPKYDVLFLRLFVMAGLGIFITVMTFLPKMSRQQCYYAQLFSVLQAGIILVETFFIFKFAVFQYPIWRNGFYFVLVLSFILKIFSPEVLKWLDTSIERLKDPKPLFRSPFILTVITFCVIAVIIWMPDPKSAVARMFFGEHFHHMDWLLMTAGWAHLSGNILGVDTISRYGVGAPIFIAEITQRLFGKFDYVNAVIVMMALSIFYYWIWFYVLKRVLKSNVWAIIAIFLGLRLHFFNMETFPCIFTYPQDTALRFFPDSIFFVLLVLHIQLGLKRFLYLAAMLAGFTIFYITGEGVYIMGTFYIFMVLREVFIIKGLSTLMKVLNKKEMIFLAIIPVVMMCLCFWFEAGAHIFTKIFWSNLFEFIRFYQAGNQTAKMISNLNSPFVDRAAVAFVLPVMYVFALLIFTGQLIEKKLKDDGLIMTVALVFLLLSYHYHATLANNMPAYLRNGVVIAMVIIYFLKLSVQTWDLYHQRWAKLICGLIVVVFIVTTHQFLLHPNILNFSSNPMTHPVVSQVPEGRKSYFSHLFISYPDAFKLPVNGLGQTQELLVKESDFQNDNQLKDLYDKESDYRQDASLIQSLTAGQDQVPVISSFENLILMQAKRRPFFYTYFMVNSQPRRMRKFPVTVLYTKDNLQREINRIEDQKPLYIFVEKTYLVSPIPQAYLYDNEDLIALLRYVFNYYAPYKGGEYLMALKRKNTT